MKKKKLKDYTQPEDERTNKQVLLRLGPDVIATLDEIAETLDTTRSIAVTMCLALGVEKGWAPRALRTERR